MSLVNIKQIRNLPLAGTGATIIYDGSTNVWSNNATGAIQLPVGNNSGERPTGLAGLLRFNDTESVLEFYDSTQWSPVITTASAAGTGQAVYSRQEADTLVFRSIEGAGVVQVRTDGDRIIVSANAQLPLPGTANDPDILYRHNGSSSQNVPASPPAKIDFGTLVKQDSIYNYSGGNVTFLETGTYRVSFDISIDNDASTDNVANRSIAESYATLNSTEIDGSKTFSYHRSGEDGTDTATTTFVIDVSANDVLEVFSFKADPSSNSLSTIANGCRLNIERISGVNGVTGNDIFGSGIINVRVSGQDVIISAAPSLTEIDVTNLGGGDVVGIGTSGNEVQLRTFVAGGAVDVRAAGDTIVVSAAPNPTNLSELTNDQGFITLTSLSAYPVRSDIVGAGSVDVRTSGNQVIVSAARAEDEFRTSVTQTAHGFTQAQPVYLDDTDGLWKLAQANNENTLGVALVDNPTTNTFDAVFGGTISSTSLVAGNFYFVSSSAAGTLTNVEPTVQGDFSNPILYATSSTEGLVLPLRPDTVLGTDALLTETSASQIYVQQGDLSSLSQFNNDTGFITQITETPLGAGTQLIVSISGGNDIQQRTITGGGIVEVSGSPTEVVVSATNEMTYFVTQNSHGFSQGDVVFLDSSDDTWKLAQANTADTLGVALVDDPATNTFTAVFGGRIDIPGAGFSPGEYYFVSPTTPGDLTATKPSGSTEYINPVLHAVSNTVGMVLPFRPTSVETAVSGGGGTGSDPDAIKQGKHTLWQPAGSMLGKISNGPDYSTTEIGSAEVLKSVYCFDSSTQEAVQFTIGMPKSWDEGSLAFQIHWIQSSAATGDVVWQMRAMALSDGDAVDGTWGSYVQVTDTGGTVNDLFIAPEGSALSVGNTPQESDMIVFEISRDAASPSDTLGADACIVGTKIFYTVDAPNDE